MAKKKATKKKATQKKTSKKEINFYYTKVNDHRAYHASGVYGGVVGDKNIHMSFFLEHQLLPRKTVHELKEDTLGGLIRSEGYVKDELALEREIQTTLVISKATAIVLKDWLIKKIKDIESIEKG